MTPPMLWDQELRTKAGMSFGVNMNMSGACNLQKILLPRTVGTADCDIGDSGKLRTVIDFPKFRLIKPLGYGGILQRFKRHFGSWDKGTKNRIIRSQLVLKIREEMFFQCLSGKFSI